MSSGRERMYNKAEEIDRGKVKVSSRENQCVYVYVRVWGHMILYCTAIIDTIFWRQSTVTVLSLARWFVKNPRHRRVSCYHWSHCWRLHVSTYIFIYIYINILTYTCARTECTYAESQNEERLTCKYL